MRVAEEHHESGRSYSHGVLRIDKDRIEAFQDDFATMKILILLKLCKKFSYILNELRFDIFIRIFLN